MGRGTVDVHVELETLIGLSERSAELAGWGPVVADIARQVAHTQANSQWRFTVTNGGRVHCTGTTRRRPRDTQRRRLQALYPTYVHPGCRRPAQRCDLDHRRPWSAGGTTCEHNLAPLCRHHHRLKHHGGWSLRRRRDGSHLWTSTLGLHYSTQPQAP